MTTNIIMWDRSRFKTKIIPTVRPLPDDAEALDDATIADLSAMKISQMTRDELVRVIKAARLPQLNSATGEHLELYDRRTLERLIFLARRCCRHRTAAAPSRSSVFSGGE
jgi:hypothetical protein